MSGVVSGTTVRIDTTLIGFEKLSWQRGHQTLIFQATRMYTHTHIHTPHTHTYTPHTHTRAHFAYNTHTHHIHTHTCIPYNTHAHTHTHPYPTRWHEKVKGSNM